MANKKNFLMFLYNIKTINFFLKKFKTNTILWLFKIFLKKYFLLKFLNLFINRVIIKKGHEMREFVFTNFNLNLLDSNFHELEVDNDEDPLNFLENLEQRLLERKKFFVQCNNLPEVQIKYLEELLQKHNYNSYILLLNDSLSLFLRVLSLNPKTTMLMEVMKNYFYCKLKIESLSFPILNVQSLEFIKNHKFNFRESLKEEYNYAIDRLKDNYIDDYIYCYEECMNLVDYNKMNFKNCKLRAR